MHILQCVINDELASSDGLQKRIVKFSFHNACIVITFLIPKGQESGRQ